MMNLLISKSLLKIESPTSFKKDKEKKCYISYNRILFFYAVIIFEKTSKNKEKISKITNFIAFINFFSLYSIGKSYGKASKNSILLFYTNSV